MTIDRAPADASTEATPPASASPAPPSWPWRRAVFFHADAAQLLTVSAPVVGDPIPATWSSLLLAIAPAPLAAAFAPTAVNLLAAVAKSSEAVVEHVREQLISPLDQRACRFEYVDLLGHPPRLQPDSTVVAGRSHWDVEHAGLPSEEIELRTFGKGQHYGRFMLRPKPLSWPSRRLRLVTIAVAEQAGRAFAARTPIPSTGWEQAERCLA